MSKISRIVNALLETDAGDDPLDIDPSAYLAHHIDKLEREKEQDRLSGEVNQRTALDARYFWHKTHKLADKRTALRAYRSGATKTWRTRPNEFRIPIKFNMYRSGYITDRNAHEWTTIEPEVLPKPPRAPKRK